MVQKSDDLKKTQIKKIHIKGYKSIKNCDIEFGTLNVLIGPNGAGKSNFISVFKLMKSIASGNLQYFVSKNGGADRLLHYGLKETKYMEIEITFEGYKYLIILEPTLEDKLVIKIEKIIFDDSSTIELGKASLESRLKTNSFEFITTEIINMINTWIIYHFHDTGELSPIKKQSQINDNMFLRADGENLAAFLYLLKNKYKKNYIRITQTMKLAAPFFGGFILRENPLSPEYISLEWHEKNKDVPFTANMLSDGTLRFICLITALLQPEDLQPDTIFIDEPELGLHPYAITLLGSLIRKVSKKKQVVISTQSVELLNEFDVEDIIVVDRENEQTTFKRLDYKNLETWLEDYSLGEIWKKNIIGGRP
ncbi:MAG TPA: AAA family ATPase [Thermotogota bacterium]|nr:AAA family ATPase [Thermotogota bacterium]HPJ89975.1 AAA family ATPase [Thermotogota bacterium]HPR97046.1 AAA family ATPase [Thermotogota bacterium]